jgi:hypothetical protein
LLVLSSHLTTLYLIWSHPVLPCLVLSYLLSVSCALSSYLIGLALLTVLVLLVFLCPAVSSVSSSLIWSFSSRLVICCLVLVFSCLVWFLPCRTLRCLVLSCVVLSCVVLSCLVLSCLVLSCLPRTERGEEQDHLFLCLPADRPRELAKNKWESSRTNLRQ